MYCPDCGKELKDLGINFCPYCGKNLAERLRPNVSEDTGTYTYGAEEQINQSYEPYSYSPPQTTYVPYPQYHVSPPKKKSNTGPKIAAFFIALIMIFAVYGVMTGGGESEVIPGGGGGETHTDHVTFSDLTVTTSGAFVNGVFSYYAGTHEFSGTVKDCVIFELNSNIASKYNYFVWNLFDTDHTAYIAYLYDLSTGKYVETPKYDENKSKSYSFDQYTGIGVAKSESKLYWSAYCAGSFNISVSCYDSESAYRSYLSPGKIYAGNFVCDGKITKTYSWNYSGSPCTASVSFEYKDFKTYKKSTSYSRSYDLPILKNYVVVNDTITSMGNSLATEYKKIYGADASLSDQRFADFVLTFVQLCFAYPSFSEIINFPGDKVMYGYSEYYAYPMETIYYEMGDCEDTSILAASLYKSLGFKTAIGLLPGHAIVGVSVPDYAEPAPRSKYMVYSGTVGNVTYYGGESTADVYVPLGFIDKNMADMSNLTPSEKAKYVFYPIDS